MQHRSRAFAAVAAGIGAALMLGAATPAPANGGVTGGVTIELSNMRSHRGQVLVCLTANPNAFPDCSRDPASYRRAVPADDAGSITFRNLAPGRYAVALIHDENANGRADMAVMIPREGFGFSRNASAPFGPPRFTRAAFDVSGEPVRQAIRLRYML